MTLRTKTLTVIGATLAALIAVFYTISATVIRKGFADVERQDTQRNVRTAVSALSERLTHLENMVDDWAVWDDTYDFINRPTSAYIKSNLVAPTFANLGLNLFLVANSSGRIVYARCYDQDGREIRHVPAKMLAQLSTDTLLLRDVKHRTSLKGLLLLPEGPMLIASHAILTSENEGPPRGALIMGRYLTAAEVQRLSHTTHLTLTIQRYHSDRLPRDFRRALPALSGPGAVLVRPLSHDTVAGYSVLQDIYSKPALLLRVDAPRAIHAQGERNVRFLIIAFCIVGVAIGLVALLLLERLVLSRLTSLSHCVAGIGLSSDLATRVSVDGQDELSTLAEAVNSMLGSLERSRQELQESEERYRAVMEQSPASVMITDTAGRIEYVNPRFTHTTGYSLEEVAGKNPRFLKSGEMSSEQYRQMWDTIIAGHGWHGEFHNRKKDGEFFWEYASISPIRNPEGAITHFLAVKEDVTPRKLAEQALRVSEERYRTLAEAAHDMIYVIGRDGTVQYANSYAAQQFNCQPGDIIGKNHSDLFPQEVAQHQERSLKQVLETGQALYVEATAQFPDGEKWLGTWLVPISDGGEANAVLGLSRDITETKRAEQALKESESRFRMVSECGLAGIYILQDNVFRYVNPAMADMFGFAAAEMMESMNPLDIVFPEDQHLVEEQMRKRLQGEVESAHYTCRCARKNGAVIWCEVLGRRIEYQGRPAIIGNVLDVTTRTEAEAALRQSEEKFRSLFEESKDTVFISTPDGKLIDINPAGVELFGYSSKVEILQSNIATDLYEHAKDRERFRTAIEEQGYVKDYEVIIRRKDGKPVTVLETATAVHDEQGNVVAYRGIMRDMTAYKQLEGQLLQAQKMESIGTLAGGVAHDFNNLLTGIIGFSEIALSEIDPESNASRHVGSVIEQGHRAATLVSQLLTFGRRTDSERLPMQLVPLVKETAKILERAIAENIRIELDIAEEQATVNADATQMQQVLMNLCVNAAHAMPTGGQLSIRLAQVLLDAEYCRRYPYAKPGPHVCLAVRDTGMGITPEIQERIFDPFFTTKATGEGTGLGLAMVYAIVKNHEGHINVYSEVGEGSEFKIYLPALAAVSPPRQQGVRGKAVGGTETILFVEDDPAVLNVGERLLKSLGYNVLRATDGEEAVKIYHLHRDDIALVITDMVMPNMGGQELHEALVKINPLVKLILVSGYSLQRDLEDLFRSGIRGFVQKPFNLSDMARVMRDILDG